MLAEAEGVENVFFYSSILSKGYLYSGEAQMGIKNNFEKV